MKSFTKTFGIALLGAFIAIGINHFIDQEQSTKTNEIVSSQKATGQFTVFDTPNGELPSFTEIAKNSVQAVVHVQTEYELKRAYDPYAEIFGRRSPNQKAKGAGSGVIIGSDGYIVSNNHVIENASKITVTLNDNKTYEAEVIGTDPSTDIALLKIEEDHLPYIEFGNSDQSNVGDWVLAVGNPFNLTSTVTAGIISAKSRNINLLRPSQNNFPIESFIQTDAAVNPGNSGGALINNNGQLIGINTAIASRTGSYSGYSFAVPSSIVQKVVNDIIEFGEVQRALIGVSIKNVNQNIADGLALKDVQGVLITGLNPNGAAKEAGLETNDVITKINGISVANVAELQEQIGQFHPGDHVQVSLIRDRNHKDIDLILRNKIGGTDLYETPQIDASKILQVELQELDINQLHKYHLKSGIQIVDFTGEKLWQAGVKKGFIITHVDRKEVSSIEDLDKVILNSSEGIFISGIYPNGQRAYYGLGV